LSSAFLRLGVSPNTVTALGLLAHAITAAIVFVLPADSALPAAAICLVGWQIAFSLDCSDGQVARASGRQSPTGAVLDLIADYLGHGLVLAIVAFKAAALIDLSDDALAPAIAAIAAISAAGWFATVHNQALAGPGNERARLLQQRMGDTLFFRIAVYGQHLLDTSVVIIALAMAMAIDGYALLGVYFAFAAIRLAFLSTRFVALLVLSSAPSDGRASEAPLV
jgi:hypothetical protein